MKRSGTFSVVSQVLAAALVFFGLLSAFHAADQEAVLYMLRVEARDMPTRADDDALGYGAIWGLLQSLGGVLIIIGVRKGDAMPTEEPGSLRKENGE